MKSYHVEILGASIGIAGAGIIVHLAGWTMLFAVALMMWGNNIQLGNRK